MTQVPLLAGHTTVLLRTCENEISHPRGKGKDPRIRGGDGDRRKVAWGLLLGFCPTTCLLIMDGTIPILLLQNGASTEMLGPSA
jgi:hypothetical protein